MTAVTEDTRSRPQPGQRAHSHGPGAAPQASRAERKTSFAVADFPVPSGREEEWRFTPVDRVSQLLEPTGTTSALTLTVAAPAGVAWRQVPGPPTRDGVFRPADRASVIAYAEAQEYTLVEVPANAELAEPVRIRLSGGRDGSGRPVRGGGHLVVQVGANARAAVVLEHVGAAMHAGGVQLQVADGARLTFVTLQEWDSDAVHVAQHDAVVGKDAVLRHVAVSLGGDVVRLSTNVRYSGTGGDATLLGLYIADPGQHLEHRLFVDHEVRDCRSRVAYKGALQGEGAHTVWVGDVLIRAAAEGTDTYELNRNLVLTDGARADSVPNLEIETGEIVGAGHASATGRFDDEQLFYLRSRGIPEDEARRLVVRGFFVELIGQIGLPDVQRHLLAAIEAELARTDALADEAGTHSE